jgi:hypothetical protein
VGRLQARGLQKLLGFLLQYVHLEVLDATLQYTQYGEPGPRPAANYLQGADAAQLHIRAIQLAPRGAGEGGAAGWEEESPAAAAAAAAAVHEAGLGRDLVQRGLTTSSLALPEQQPAARGQPGQQGQPAAGADGSRAGVAAAAAAAGGEESFWRLLLRLPGVLWGHVVMDRPSATQLSITGVSLVLQTYPTTWPGFYAAQRQQGQQQQGAAAGRVWPPAPFAFTAGTGPGRSRQAEESGPDAAERKRRRPGGAARAAADQAEQQQAQRAQQGGRAADAGPPPSQQARQAARAGPDWVPHPGLLARAPVEEHIVFRQWEATVMLCLLPPSHVAAAAASAPAGPGPSGAAAAAAGGLGPAGQQGPGPEAPGGPLHGGLQQNGLDGLGSPFGQDAGFDTGTGGLGLEPLDSGEAPAWRWSSHSYFRMSKRVKQVTGES